MADVLEIQTAIDERRLGMAKLADRAADFRLGTRKYYEDRGPNNGDMWFFELWHFLGDAEVALRGEAAPADANSQKNSRTDINAGDKDLNLIGNPGAALDPSKL